MNENVKLWQSGVMTIVTAIIIWIVTTFTGRSIDKTDQTLKLIDSKASIEYVDRQDKLLQTKVEMDKSEILTAISNLRFEMNGRMEKQTDRLIQAINKTK